MAAYAMSLGWTQAADGANVFAHIRLNFRILLDVLGGHVGHDWTGADDVQAYALGENSRLRLRVIKSTAALKAP